MAKSDHHQLCGTCCILLTCFELTALCSTKSCVLHARLHPINARQPLQYQLFLNYAEQHGRLRLLISIPLLTAACLAYMFTFHVSIGCITYDLPVSRRGIGCEGSSGDAGRAVQLAHCTAGTDCAVRPHATQVRTFICLAQLVCQQL